jgi:hypothetical protein
MCVSSHPIFNNLSGPDFEYEIMSRDLIVRPKKHPIELRIIIVKEYKSFWIKRFLLYKEERNRIS